MMLIIVFGAIIVALSWALMFFIRSIIHGRGPRRTGIPRRTVAGALMLAVIGLTAVACAILFLGGPEVRNELARRRQLTNVTQSASAVVEVHRCYVAVSLDTEVVYHFEAPDPATSHLRIYRQHERLTSAGQAVCTPTTTPYQRAIWYDPANPQHATAQPLVAGDFYRPLGLFIFVSGCFGLLPLAGAISALLAIARRGGPDAQQIKADVRLMEEAGFIIALDARVIGAARDIEGDALMGRYVCVYNGRRYLSLDFIADPAERDAAWNALWRVQAKDWQLEGDEARVREVLGQLRRGGADARSW